MKNLLISLLFLFYAQIIFATSIDKDSTIKSNLTYHSKFEEKNFMTYIADKQFDTLGFLLAIDSVSSFSDLRFARNELQSFFKGVDTGGDKKKKNLKKFIDFLFTKTHAQFLKKYEENVGFNRIFKDGIYNCVTATALYALVFEHYGIPYHIKELPTHVYIVADPNGLAIRVESTDPKGGYFAPSDKFKKNYVNQLLENKTVTQSEVATEGVQSVFTQHYYENKNANITIQQLVALLYYNWALALNEEEKYKSAFLELEKAYFLYPSERIKYVLVYAVYTELNKNSTKTQENDIEVVKLFAKMFPYIDFAKQRRTFLSAFDELSKEVLINKNKVEYYDQIYTIYASTIPDSTTLSELHFIYNANKGEEAFLKSKFKLSIVYSEKCLAINPENLQMKSNFAKCILRSVGNRMDFEKILSELDNYAAKYSFLTENDVYIKVTAIYLMGASSLKCSENDYDSSLKFFERFEKLMSEHPIDFEDDIVGAAYGEASSYCIRKLIDYDKARDWINRGLKYVPDSPILKRKLDVLNENPMPSKSKVSTEELKVFDIKEVKLGPPPNPKKKKTNN